MAAYYSVAMRTLPLLLLFLEEFINTFASDVFQVLNHAHVVFGSVAPIKGFKPATGEVRAFITEPYKPFPDQVAMLAHENTILAARQTPRAISPIEPLLVQVNLHGEVTDT